MRHVLTAGALLALAAFSAQSHAGSVTPVATEVPAGDYALDKAHSTLLFRVNHLGFSNFTGRFTSFDAKLQLDPADPAAARLEAKVDPSSIATDNPPAGFLDLLRGAEWLNVVKFPEITFRSTAIELTSPNTARITGDFSLHGVTEPVILDATFNGGYAGHALEPNARIGFSARGSLKRSAFGIAFGIPAPGTTMGVGDEVEIVIETEFTGPRLAKAATAQ